MNGSRLPFQITDIAEPVPLNKSAMLLPVFAACLYKWNCGDMRRLPGFCLKLFQQQKKISLPNSQISFWQSPSAFLLDDATAHIQKYSTGHSGSDRHRSLPNGTELLNDIDAAAVYINASSRFTDGGCFGFGGEIGISTQNSMPVDRWG